MRIQHNIMAMSAYRNYTNNVSAMQKNLEKLSSGYKINRAGDDAAGLAISEKMRAQITGLETAQKNAKDGISLVQTAEGALTEVHDMLNRMVELATQSANGTYEDTTDRAQLQKEVNQLLDEINRIADSSNFNGINLLDGSMAITDAIAGGSTTSEVDVEGMDRIIQSIIGKGEKAYDVAGQKTILDGTGAEAKRASFEIDLKTLDFNVSGGSAAGSTTTTSTTYSITAGGTLTLNGGAETVTVTVDASTGALTATGAVGATVGTVTWNADGTVGTATVTTTADTTGDTVTIKKTVTSTTTPAASVASGTTASKISINIGGTKYTTDNIKISASTAAASAGSVNAKIAADVAQALLDKMANTADATTAEVTINNVKWTVTASAGKLKFEQVDLPETADEARANFDVKIGISQGDNTADNNTLTIDLGGNAGANSAGTEVTLTMSASIKPGTYVGTAGVAAEDANKADTIFRIDESDLTDGTQIAIGSVTVVLKVGGNSTVKASDYATVTKFVTLNEGDDLNTALCKISEKIGSTVNLKIKDPADNSVKTVKFQIGVSDGSQGFPKGLAIQRINGVGKGSDSGKDLAFDTIDKLAANFKMRVKETTTIEAKEANKGLRLQIGDTADEFNQLVVSIEDCHASALGIADIDIGTQDGAAAAVQKIKDAINYVSDVRGTLGATQNRLDHTMNNLSVMTENIQDAESTIRDVDVAEEMMAYTKNNILIQSAQAMLAQANQVPQGVLQLLQ